MGKKHILDIQVRFADADILGHINNVNMLHYFDLGKTRFYYDVMNRQVKPDKEGSMLVSVSVDYFAQSFPYDDLCVETMVEKIGTKSITFLQRLVNKKTGNVNAQCRTVAVCFDFEAQTSIEVKPSQREMLEEYIIE